MNDSKWVKNEILSLKGIMLKYTWKEKLCKIKFIDIDSSKVPGDMVVQWMEHRLWKPGRLFSASHQQH